MSCVQPYLIAPVKRGDYRPVLTAAENVKGVLDVDSVKGCADGMAAYPDGGCYGECYACKIATRYGIDFTKSVCRKVTHKSRLDAVAAIRAHYASWYRVGTFGDPSYDWDHTIYMCEQVSWSGKQPVIITKHWRVLSDTHLDRLRELDAVVNTSTSGMDTDPELSHRLMQLDRVQHAGVHSVCRVVTCQYGTSKWALACQTKQDFLLSLPPVIDNPLRVSANNPRVLSGEIIATRCPDAVGGGTLVSLHDESVYLGVCKQCPDQCGARR